MSVTMSIGESAEADQYTFPVESSFIGRTPFHLCYSLTIFGLKCLTNGYRGRAWSLQRGHRPGHQLERCGSLLGEGDARASPIKAKFEAFQSVERFTYA